MKPDCPAQNLGFAVATRSVEQPGVTAVRIRSLLRTKIRVLLLRQNLFSIDWFAADAATLGPVTAALGRIVATHGENRAADELAAHCEALEEAGRGLPRPNWLELPRVRVTPVEEKDTWACYGVRDGVHAATLFLSVGTEVPLGCLLRSAATPSWAMCSAIGRLALAQAESFPRLNVSHSGAGAVPKPDVGSGSGG